MGFRERSNPKVMREVEVNCTRTGLNYLTTWLEERISDWTRMKRIVGIVLKYKQILKQKLPPVLNAPVLNAPSISSNSIIDAALLEKASVEIMKMRQQREFLEKLKIIEKACRKYLNIKDEITLTKSSPIYDLDLFLDDNGVLSVGSWLSGVDLNLT